MDQIESYAYGWFVALIWGAALQCFCITENLLNEPASELR
jgi:hypothetical protein